MAAGGEMVEQEAMEEEAVMAEVAVVAMEEMAEMAGPAVKEEKVVKADLEATMDATGVMDK